MDSVNGPSEIFKGKADVFKGITIATDEQNWNSPEEFERLLTGSLEHWHKTSIRGVWVKIPLHQADLVGIVAKNGFVFHHAQPDYVMMTRWLPKDEPNMLPGFASHYIGVGGFVLNDRNELLVIQELYRQYGKHYAWKLPGGSVDPGERLPEAVCREVYEETGVKAEFVSICCFRHLQNFRFGRSDIYFICRLRPLTTEINMCANEIAACRWMKIEEYLSSSDVHENNKYFARQCLAGLAQDRTVDLHPEIIMGQEMYSILPKPEEVARESGNSEDALLEEELGGRRT